MPALRITHRMFIRRMLHCSLRRKSRWKQKIYRLGGNYIKFMLSAKKFDTL